MPESPSSSVGEGEVPCARYLTNAEPGGRADDYLAALGVDMIRPQVSSGVSLHHVCSQMKVLGRTRSARSSGLIGPVAIAAGILAALLVSCASPGEPPRDDLGPVPDGAFTTDATGYVAHRLPGNLPRYQFRIIARFENRGAATLYLGRCFPDSPQPTFTVQNTGPAESGYEQAWACVGHNRQFVIQSGEARVDTFVVEGPNTFQGGKNVGGVAEGDFRLYYDVRLAPGDGAPPAPDSTKLSNAFRVRTSQLTAPEQPGTSVTP